MPKKSAESAAPDAAATTPDTSAAPEKSLASRFAESVAGLGQDPAPDKKDDPAPDADPAPDKADAAPDKKEADPAPDKKESAPSDDPDPDSKVEEDIKKATPGMTPAQKAAFTNLRYSERDARRKMHAMEKELEALKANPPAAAAPDEAVVNEQVTRLQQELESTKAKLTEYEGEIKISRIEATEEYKARIEAPKMAIGTEVEALVTKYKLDEKAAIAVFREDNSDAVAALTADMNDFDRYRFYDLVKQFRGIEAEEGRMRQNAAEELDRINRTRREQTEISQKAAKEEWDKAAPDVWQGILDEFPALAPVEGDPEWNKSVEAVREYATPNRFDSLTTRERIEVLHRAAAFPVLRAEFEANMAELQRVQGELAKYEAASPDVRPGGGDAGDEGPGEDMNIPLAQRMARRLQKAGVAR